MADSLFPNPHPEEPFREPVAKLAKMITDRALLYLVLRNHKRNPRNISGFPLCVRTKWQKLP